MPASLTRFFPLIARIILGIYFLLPGLMKFTDYEATSAYMASHSMILIPFFLVLTGVIQIGAAAALFAGYRIALTAFVLAGLTLIISIVLHDFWNMESGLARSHETQNFFKNMGIMAGLLILSSAGAGAFSLDSRGLRLNSGLR